MNPRILTSARALVFAGLLFTLPGSAAPSFTGGAPLPTQTNKNSGPKQPAIEYQRGRLSVKIHDVSLAAVLKILAERLGARIVIFGSSHQPVNADFTGEPLEQGIKRLLGGRNSVFFYVSEGQPEMQMYRLTEVRVFPPPGEVAFQSDFRPDREAKIAAAANGSRHDTSRKTVNPAIAQLAKRLVEEKNTQARQQAIKELGRMADPEAIEALREALLLDGEPAVRAAAAEFLAKTWDEAAVEPLARALSQDRSANVREAAATALGVTWSDQAVVPLVNALLADRDALVREHAARALGEIGSEAAIEGLAQALQSDARMFVREAAAIALGSIGGTHALEALANATSAESDPWVQEAVALSTLNGRR